MGGVRKQPWSWVLCIVFSLMCMDWTEAEPSYLVGFPVILEAGAETSFCASLLQPNETMTMTVFLNSKEENNTLFKEESSKDFHKCHKFMVPVPNSNEEVLQMVVEVKGATFFSREVKKVLIRVYKPTTFIQTDKPIYLPGQTVQFRVVSLDTQFRPASQMYKTIEIQNPSNSRIGQWLNQTSNGKILQLSYSLNSEARQGIYQVIVSVNEENIYHSFKVEKYVLPKFDVKINGADEVVIVEDNNIEVCSKYTYGQPVPGTVTLKVCRPIYSYLISNANEGPIVTPPCHEERKPTNKTGCATFTVKLSTFTKIDQKAVQDVLEVHAEMEEEGTGVSHPQYKRIQISYVIGKLSFENTPKTYEKASQVEGKVKAVHYNNTPIVNLDLYLLEGNRWSPNLRQNLTTDQDGFASFSISTANREDDIHIYVSATPNLDYDYRTPYYEKGEHTVSQFQPPSLETKTVSYLVVKNKDAPIPCEKDEDVTIQYNVVGESQGLADLMYLVLARGAIVFQGAKQIVVKDKSVTEGEVTFQLKVSPEMAPVVQVVAYAVLPSATVIAQSAHFTTEKCFRNKVSVEFCPSSAVPGEETILQVTTQPNSLCGVSAVDQSVLIKEPGKTLNTDEIFRLLPVTQATYIPYKAEDSVECLSVRPRRSILPYPRHDIDDAFTVFQRNGLKMATNLHIRVPTCLRFQGREYHHSPYGIALRYETVDAMAAPNAVAGLGGSAAPIQTIRNFFPETWLWDLVDVGNSGMRDISLKAPDTITTWETEAFCLSSQGFGLAPRQKLTVFQPFFLELTLPYSIKRGEHFELKATVFNFLSKCIMVRVTPAASSAFSLTPLSGDEYNSCLCGNERKTLRWTLTPSTLGVANVTVTAEAVPSHTSCDNEVVSVPERGRIDVVTRTLIVKAEGTEVTKAYNWLFCPKGGNLKEETDLKLPANVIGGSARGLISVLGDILGRALKNIDGLLRMPYGCGEQNMALFAPNIYILQYLKDTQQLTPAIKEKTLNFLTSGYQRQLNYKHSSGGYSTFGTGEENTWLTAFVMRSFAKASSFIYIDPSDIEDSQTWLERKQKENGCFQKSGKLFNNRMKGGVSDEVTLSAYVTAAFLERGKSVNDATVTQGLSCLKAAVNDHSNVYTTALLAYVFTLAGDKDTRANLLQHLDSIKIQQDGFIHWSQKSTETSQSLSVEITSYVLLAKLGSSPTVEDLGYASGIVRWLTTQQNYYGGFASTQDTVVALQALALYSTLVFSPGGSSTVTVSSPSGLLTFDVNQNNKLLYQEEVLNDVSGHFSMEVKGSACASVQLTLLYNIPTPTETTTLSVAVETNCTSASGRPKVELKMKSLYSGKESSTNMVVLEISLLSGFQVEPKSFQRLKGSLLVERVEKEEDRVLVYLTEIPKDIPIYHFLELIQEIPVQDLKPAVIKLYDYYQPSDQAETIYNFDCKTG
ncbi:alpha-2-macroglobulin-like [Corythoichthys intestinalis]|uniref:alpha-2-macroglobulin-like n=1 Tax=Corythoichthys intestinalis TaxID=161448 RepID=UPI0025A5FA16|nr:alpha-2-macroglobulin-like [Corythoichthys intestinalis]XP_057695615.1 alpha-2-macroglobulin-like [Corythoichthys intestinalis]